MDEQLIDHPYQRELAERSLVVDDVGDGEYWTFYWYIDPISRGLSRWYRFFAHISSEGQVNMIGMFVARDEEERLAQEQALRFVKTRYERVGLGVDYDTSDQKDQDV